MPEAALQFAVAGDGGFRLKETSTFSAIGKEALDWVGRQKLWFDEVAMLDFATKSKQASPFAKWIGISGVLDAELAPQGACTDSQNLSEVRVQAGAFLQIV